MTVPGPAYSFPDEADNLLLPWPMETCLLYSIFPRQQEPSPKIAGQRLLWLVMFPSWPSR